MMKNKDDKMKEKIQEKIPAAAPLPPSPPPPSRKGEGEIPDRYVEQEDNGNKSKMSQVKGQAGIWRPAGYPVIKCPRRIKKRIHP